PIRSTGRLVRWSALAAQAAGRPGTRWSRQEANELERGAPIEQQNGAANRSPRSVDDHGSSPREVERERVRATARVRRWESPRFDLVSDAALGFGRARAAPGAIGDVHARDVTAARERN